VSDEFADEPGDDPLQLAGDVALSAIRGALRGYGIGVDDYSVVITLASGEDLTTVLHIPGDDERDTAVVAFETQVLHAAVSARALGLELRVVGKR
jgi:hypothetical protein